MVFFKPITSGSVDRFPASLEKHHAENGETVLQIKVKVLQIKVKVVQIKVKVVQIKVKVLQIKVKVVQIKVKVIQIKVTETPMFSMSASHKSCSFVYWKSSRGSSVGVFHHI